MTVRKTITACARCGTMVEHYRNTSRKYCSSYCRIQASRHRHGLPLVPKILVFTCAWEGCGQKFEIPWNATRRHYCGPKCRSLGTGKKIKETFANQRALGREPNHAQRSSTTGRFVSKADALSPKSQLVVDNQLHGYVGPGWITYETYLQTQHWAGVRQRALGRAGLRCQVCAATSQLEVHHNTYAHLGAEPLLDLFVMCSAHHASFHTGPGMPKPPRTLYLDKPLRVKQ